MGCNGTKGLSPCLRPLIVYYGYCGIPQHGGREAVSPTLVGLVTLCSGLPGRLECFRVEEKV